MAYADDSYHWQVFSINEVKTKYMVAANTQNCSKSCAIEIGRYSFERVGSYTYLSSMVNDDVSEEIINCLIAANRSYFGIKSEFKLQLLSRKTKILLYKTFVRPILTYTTETWTTTKNDEKRLIIFKRKILHIIFGPICKGRQRWKRYNKELKSFTINHS
jgi:hypothetical protein